MVHDKCVVNFLRIYLRCPRQLESTPCIRYHQLFAYLNIETSTVGLPVQIQAAVPFAGDAFSSLFNLSIILA